MTSISMPADRDVIVLAEMRHSSCMAVFVVRAEAIANALDSAKQ